MISTRLLAQVKLDTSSLPNNGSTDVAQSMLPVALKILFATLGAIALLMVVISGFRYIVASGDPQSMAQAKRSILFAILGLVIALSGFSIVIFVVKGLG